MVRVNVHTYTTTIYVADEMIADKGFDWRGVQIERLRAKAISEGYTPLGDGDIEELHEDPATAAFPEHLRLPPNCRLFLIRILVAPST
jgi:hypothetical protein